jgi:hypothetical protein
VKFKLMNAKGEDMTGELQGFAEMIGLEAAAPGRYSIALLIGLFGSYKSRTQDPRNVVREIEALAGC